ncbi:MAG TPA: response regulator [Blastocatellia bacterium]|nr:response regulator [Blastocatellia bacterium]
MPKTCVLLAEDNQDQRDLYTFVLKQAGFEVCQAEDGNSALAELHRHRPDILVTDVMMPGMNGIELIERIRNEEELHDLPIVVLSAYSDILIKAHLKGATEIIQKPIDDVYGFVTTLLNIADPHKEH